MSEISKKLDGKKKKKKKLNDIESDKECSNELKLDSYYLAH